MTAALAARGPDGEGFHGGEDCCLGHRRLAVIDPAGGVQPLYAAGGEVACVVNGEIYNYRELGDELRGLGHDFATACDAEVVAHGYAAWGADVVHRLEGMFAFAVWDRRAEALVLARDRMGEKPLYWSHRAGGALVFASELRALLRYPDLAAEIDPAALARYLVCEHVPAPRSLIRGVHKLEPGTLLVHRRGGAPRVRRYWDLPLVLAPPGGRVDRVEDAARRLRARIAAAVPPRLHADVPLGAFLSGGLDSTVVAALAAEARGGDLDTFTIAFDDPSYDESMWARRAAEHIGSRHHERRVAAGDLLDLVPRLGALLDEPLGDASIVPTHLLARFAREHVTVAVGGDGGDELFGGYPTFRAEAAARVLDRLPRRARAFAVAAGGALAARLPVSAGYVSADFVARQFFRGAAEGGPRRHQAWLASFLPAEARAVLAPNLADAIAGEDLLDVASERAARCPSPLPDDRLVYVYARGYLGDGVLAKVDRASMACGLEVRAPLLDTSVVELACHLAPALRWHRGATKIALRAAARGLIPDAIIDRPKHGFGMPVAAWLRGPLAEVLRDTLAPARLAAGGLLAPAAVARMIDDHVAGRRDHRKPLWTLLALQLWLDAL